MPIEDEASGNTKPAARSRNRSDWGLVVPWPLAAGELENRT